MYPPISVHGKFYVSHTASRVVAVGLFFVVEGRFNRKNRCHTFLVSSLFFECATNCEISDNVIIAVPPLNQSRTELNFPRFTADRNGRVTRKRLELQRVVCLLFLN